MKFLKNVTGYTVSTSLRFVINFRFAPEIYLAISTHVNIIRTSQGNSAFEILFLKDKNEKKKKNQKRILKTIQLLHLFRKICVFLTVIYA